MFDAINCTLDAIRALIRPSVIGITARAQTPSPTVSSLSRRLKDWSFWSIWLEMYKATQPYLSAHTRNASADANPPDVNDALFAVMVSNSLFAMYPITELETLANELCDSLTRNIASIDDCSTTVRKLKELSDDYAKVSYEALWSIRPNLSADADLLPHLRARTDDYIGFADVETLMLDTHANPSTPPSRQDLANTLRRLLALLKSDQLDTSARRFICNQGPGSCGMYFHEDLAFMYLKPVFSHTLERAIPNELLQFRHTIFNDGDDPQDIEDPYQQQLEERFQRMFVRTTPMTGFSANLFRSKRQTPFHSGTTTPGTRPGTHAGTRRHHPSGGRHSEGTRTPGPSTFSSFPPPPAPNPASANPIPDDDHYEPDSMLANLAKAFTASIRSETSTNAAHDHMSRFGATTESPVSVSRSQLLKGDWKIQVRDRYGNRDYLVTYTRKSKKPIFSFIL